jgi:tetratricopeptide (TPR) repeat protein
MMSSNVHFEKGEVLCELGRFVLAEQESRQEIAVNPDFADAYALLGWCLLQQGKPEALDEIQHAIYLSPDKANFHGILALYWLSFRERDNARAAIHEALRLNPYSAYYFFILACIQVDESECKMYSGNAKDIADKESKFYAGSVFPAIEQSLALDPHHIPALNLYTNALAKVGRIGEAIDNSLITLALNPNDALTLKNHGVLLFEANNFVEAANYFNKALKIDPNLAEANNLLLRSRRRIRRLEIENKFAVEYSNLLENEKDSIKASKRKRELDLDCKRSKQNKPLKYKTLEYIKKVKSCSNYILLAAIFLFSLSILIIYVIWNTAMFLPLSVVAISIVLMFAFTQKS